MKTVLKKDLFGNVYYFSGKHAKARWQALGLPGACPNEFSERNTRGARFYWRPLAKQLAAREARVLKQLPDSPQLPKLLAWQQGVLLRSWVAGQPMQVAKPVSASYFSEAQQLLRLLHRHNIVHNDSAKEPNWLVMPNGKPALIDYQLAWLQPERNRLFRTLAKEDIRHLLKHKRTYRSDLLTAREQQILATPAATSRIWMATAKPVYTVITRKIFRWADREGAGDREL